MRWTFNLLQVRGIDIKIHATFLLILALGGLEWGRAHGAVGFVFGVSIMLALFACVTLHELGHSVAAQHYKIPVREIVLLPIGGVALLEKQPDKPSQELVIAAAGPAVNVVIAVVLAALGGPLAALDGHGLVAGVAPTPSLSTFFAWLLAANITLVIFNLIPAFPLDGGRMLRAALAMATDHRRATVIAAGVGQVAAVGLGVLGIVSGNFILGLIALFIFFGAGAERFQVRATSAVAGVSIGDAYDKDAVTLRPGDRLSTVFDTMLANPHQNDFAVTLGGRLLGVVNRQDVRRMQAVGAENPYVAEVMERQVPQVEASADLDEVQQRMGAERVRLVAVYAGDRFLGLVSREDLRRALSMLLNAARRQAVDST